MITVYTKLSTDKEFLILRQCCYSVGVELVQNYDESFYDNGNYFEVKQALRHIQKYKNIRNSVATIWKGLSVLRSLIN